VKTLRDVCLQLYAERVICMCKVRDLEYVVMNPIAEVGEDYITIMGVVSVFAQEVRPIVIPLTSIVWIQAQESNVSR